MPFLAVAGAPLEREAALLAAEFGGGDERFAARHARATTLAERAANLRRWRLLEARLGPLRRQRLETLRQRAVDAGARELSHFHAATHPEPPGELVEPYCRAVIEPLDGPISVAVRERLGATPCAEDGTPLPPPPFPVQLAARVDRARVRSTTGALADVLGLPVPEIADTEAEEAPGEALERLGPTGTLLLARQPGPAGLRGALAGLGRTTRSSFLRRERPAASEWSDPAFAVATEVLFRRLCASRRFLVWAGIGEDARLVGAARLEDAVATREAWVYLSLACSGAAAPDDEAERKLQRAAGKPPSPDRRAKVWEADPSGAAMLRGSVLAILLEERLLARHGREWFRDRSAGRRLIDLWAAEAGETAESLSALMDLGTIEPTPLLDRCRP